jgi:hypothetical protein
MNRLRFRWLGLLLALSLAACAAGGRDAGGNGGNGGNGKNQGFYGSTTGGWTQLRPQ